MEGAGTIVVLNGTPRSGKSSIAAALQGATGGVWLNLGVDAFESVTPAHLRPGIGLRPGGERPDLEPYVVALFEALYESVLACSRLGFDVVVDVGHHDDFSSPRGILPAVARRLAGLPAYLVGVHCPDEEILARRETVEPGREGRYAGPRPDGTAPDIVRRWDRAVHDPGIYDLEVDTARSSPAACAAAIAGRIGVGAPTAFAELARR